MADIYCRVPYVALSQDGIVSIRLAEVNNAFNREFDVQGSARREMLALAIAAVTSELKVAVNVAPEPVPPAGQPAHLVGMTLLNRQDFGGS